jgi:TolB-like protein
MNFRPDILKPIGPNALAQEPDFNLGELSVSPSRLEIGAGDRQTQVQPRVMQVLVALAGAQGGVVSRDELIRTCWGGRIVGEDAISRCISKARELASFPGKSAFEIETIPRVGYRLKLKPVSSPSGRTSSRPALTDDVVLAVLAFDNICDGADMAYFAEGVSEEILLTVARGAELKVIGRGSSFQFRGAQKAAAQVAKVLHATHVLDGSVRRSGNNLRISANLIECAGETTVWSARFDRELSNVFHLQDEIASAVAAALKVAFAPGAKRGSVNPVAYDLYLKALDIRNRGVEAPTRLAIVDLLEEATRLAPDFARAWVFLATMKATHVRFDEPDQLRAFTHGEIVHAAETGLRLDPTLGAAFQALAYLEPFGAYARREALQMKALSVAPHDPTVLTNASLFFTEVGRVRDGLEYAKRAYDLDPMYPWAANWYANALDYAGDVEEALPVWQRLHGLWPSNELIVWNTMFAAVGRGDWNWFDRLIADANRRKLGNWKMRKVIAYCEALRGTDSQSGALELNRRLNSLRETGTGPLSTYMLLYRLGLGDTAFELLEQASFAYLFESLQCSPAGSSDDGLIFAVLHNADMMRDIRFVRLCSRLGMCDYWVKSGKWPDCAEFVAPCYDFKAEARRQTEA